MSGTNKENPLKIAASAWRKEQPSQAQTVNPQGERTQTVQERVIDAALELYHQRGMNLGYEIGLTTAKKPKNIWQSFSQPITAALTHLASQTGEEIATDLVNWADNGLQNDPAFRALNPQERQPSKFETNTKQFFVRTAKRVGKAAFNAASDYVKKRQG